MAERESSLEGALTRTESDVDAALRQGSALVQELKKAGKAAGTGTVRDLERALGAADGLAATLRDAVRLARDGWRFDVVEHLSSGAYTAELLAAAREAGLRLEEQDERLLSFPSLVRLVPGDAALEIDRKRERGIRPSAVIARLRAARERPVRFRAQPFLEALFNAYRLVLAAEGRSERGGVVKVLELYRVFTVMPRAVVGYPKPEFARDLYLLEESGVRRARDGSELRFSAATGTKGTQTLTTVSRDGRPMAYYGLEFVR